MVKWTEYYRIVEEQDDVYSDLSDLQYKLVEIHSGNVVATYKDFTYAKKQAKYRFKKLQKRVENILLK